MKQSKPKVRREIKNQNLICLKIIKIAKRNKRKIKRIKFKR